MQVSYVRLNLCSALLNTTLPGSNQIAEMGGSIRGDNEAYQRRPTRKIALDDDHSIVVAAEPVRCSETRSYKGSKILISPEAYEMASWRRAVSLLPTTYQVWTRYCYGDSLAFEDQTLICLHTWSAFQVYQTEIGAPRMSKKVKAMIQRFVWLAVQVSKKIANWQPVTYSATELALLAGVTAQNWSMNYQTRWEALLQVIEVLDQEALTYAAQKYRTESCIC
ncbi:bacteriophage antitermination protein Q [Serratia fonticola]|uniref:bacteriophage antitermination protein Q n=1 Tax=Serratia fonticola TaxID=47917 RepID=UPI001C529BAE|nr:bacteriophage antitermination protein Q [Serratia fonticola]